MSISANASAGYAVMVLGSFVVDLTCRTPHLPAPGETVFGGPFKMGPGGKGSNQAVAAARAGAKTKFVSKVGQDEMAPIGFDAWKQSGVDCSHVAISKTAGTGVALIMVENGSSQNMIVVAPGACLEVSEDEVRAGLAEIGAAKVFLTQLETNLEATLLGLTLASAAGIETILNPAPVQEIPDSVYAMVDHLTPNETEAAALTGLKIENEEEAIVAARTLLARGVRKAVHLTMGKAGVVSVPAGDGPVIRVPSFKVQAVDTTGAGDAFSGGFAAALVEGMAREKALIFASATAALSVTKHGTAPAMPSRAEIDSFLAEHS